MSEPVYQQPEWLKPFMKAADEPWYEAADPNDAKAVRVAAMADKIHKHLIKEAVWAEINRPRQFPMWNDGDGLPAEGSLS